MKLTLQSDYALRILMSLGNEPERIISVEEIAKKFEISKNHLMKVAQTLASNGYINTVRGRYGGLKLAAQPDQIRIGEVICAMEPDMNAVECLAGCACILLPRCKLKPVISAGIASFIDVLNEKTLTDICN